MALKKGAIYDEAIKKSVLPIIRAHLSHQLFLQLVVFSLNHQLDMFRPVLTQHGCHPQVRAPGVKDNASLDRRGLDPTWNDFIPGTPNLVLFRALFPALRFKVRNWFRVLGFWAFDLEALRALRPPQATEVLSSP